MPLKAAFYPHTLQFRFEASTSRGVLTEKVSWFIKIFDTDSPTLFGLGECSPLKGLSVDDRPDFENSLSEICSLFNDLDLEIFEWNLQIILDQLTENNWPSVRFGFETAMRDFMNGGRRLIFDNDFSLREKPININGLIWMGSQEAMLEQIEQKLNAGFTTLKLKIGAIGFDQECAVLANIRKQFSASEITIRVDANGAFDTKNVLEKLKKLSEFELHSIEQPIKQGQIEQMSALCQNSPIPVALDEELIGDFDYAQKRKLLKTIQPQYIILKPTLLGGFNHCREWIETAQRLGIDWWITSALESNIGLNAIAQFTAEFNNNLPQGLGTGQLYHNNIESPLQINNGQLSYNQSIDWSLTPINSLLQ
jgi:o-succinylbenzoate synthase